MFKWLAASLTLIFVFSAARSQNVLSLHALFTERDLTLIPKAESAWLFENARDSLIIRKAGDNFYWLQYSAGRKNALFEAAFVAMGPHVLIDLLPKNADTLTDDYHRSSLLPCHRFYKVEVSQDTLQLKALSYKWFYDGARKKDQSLKYDWTDDGMILEMPTAELKTYILGHIDDEGLFEEPVIFSRKTTDSKKAKSATKHAVAFREIQDEPSGLFQDYIPEFPMRDGWLGGDGNVSVPIGNNKTLWLFSDSYVGEKNQASRAKSFMLIPNSVAITSKGRNDHAETKYFWRNKYSDHPAPIFQTSTERYKFWVSDAFMYKKDLYVLLLKIGPKPGAAPGDLFSFNHIGKTMAKIGNAASVSPDKWEIQLYPYSKFFDTTMEVYTLVKQGEYVYFFINRNERITQLTRLHVDHLHNPGDHFEYYSSAATWKTGYNSTDMDTIITGPPGNTIRYHDDRKQWVMVSGPGFLDNKIRMRWSTSLTGPWSAEKVIYECPEVSPGSKLYDANNYCYLGREHFQFFNKREQMMLLTYDWNTSDGDQLKKNSQIYVPRVVRIPLEQIIVKAFGGME